MVTRKEMDSCFHCKLEERRIPEGSRMCVREPLLPCLCAASQPTQEGKRPGQCGTSRPEPPDSLQTAKGHARSFHLASAEDQLLKTKSKSKADRKKPTGRSCLKEQLDWELRPQNKGPTALTSPHLTEVEGNYWASRSPLLVTEVKETLPE